MIILNANEELKRLKSFEDKLADKITAFAGSMRFVYAHVVWFGVWVLINTGLLAVGISIFDKFPFGLLTLVVSLEAIFLSTFVMISQNRQAKLSEIRSELDYQTDLRAEKEIDVIARMIERLAGKQDIKVADLLDELAEARKPRPLNIRRRR